MNVEHLAIAELNQKLRPWPKLTLRKGLIDGYCWGVFEGECRLRNALGKNVLWARVSGVVQLEGFIRPIQISARAFGRFMESHKTLTQHNALLRADHNFLQGRLAVDLHDPCREQAQRGDA